MRVKFCAILTILGVFCCLSPTFGDVTLQAEKVAELDGGETWGTFEKWVVSAVADANETINVFTTLNIEPKDGGMGIHQVWGVPGGFGDPNPTPLESDHGNPSFDWNETWDTWDSFFRFSPDDFALVAGSAVIETNDETTTGDLGLPLGDLGSSVAISGFGTLGQGLTGSYTIAGGTSDVDFLCLVVKQGDDILLDITIGGVLEDNQTGFEKDFTDFMLLMDQEETPPQITVMGNSMTIANGDNTPSESDNTDFGTNTKDTTTERVFTIVNDGDQELTLTDPPIFTGPFSLASTFPTSIAGGGSAMFTVAMDISTVGVFGGSISIENNDSGNNPYTFDLAGTVTMVPEPSTLVLASLALVGIVGYLRRREG